MYCGQRRDWGLYDAVLAGTDPLARFGIGPVRGFRNRDRVRGGGESVVFWRDRVAGDWVYSDGEGAEGRTGRNWWDAIAEINSYGWRTKVAIYATLVLKLTWHSGNLRESVAHSRQVIG